MTGAIDLVHINGIIEDRRVARLHELFSGLDAEVAASTAAEYFEQEFSSFQKLHETADILPERYRHGLESKLFLCSEFCSREQLADLVERWYDWHELASLGKSYKAGTRPNFLLVANLQLNSLASERGFTLRETNEWMAKQLAPVLPKNGLPQLKLKPLMASHWTTNRQDILKLVPVFESMRALHSTEGQRLLLHVLGNEAFESK